MKRDIEYIEERSFWWNDLQERIHKLSVDLEDALFEHFQALEEPIPWRYMDARPEDPDFTIVNNIWQAVLAIEEVVKMRRQVLDIAVGKYHTFCEYWRPERGDWTDETPPKILHYDGFTKKVVG